MFFLAVACFLVAIVALVVAVAGDKDFRIPALIVFVVASLLTICIVSMPSNQLTWKKQWAGTAGANWLVVDCSGGQTLRHWVLEGGLVKASSSGSGWEFTDASGSINYIGGDSFVRQINEPLDVFRQHYRKSYNIPEGLIALK